MDLSLIQTHIDNFVDTWEGWGKVANVFFGDDSIFTMLSKAIKHLSSDSFGSSTFIPNTVDAVKENQDAAEAAA